MPKSDIMYASVGSLCGSVLFGARMHVSCSCFYYASNRSSQDSLSGYVVISMNRVTPTYTPTYHNPELITYNRGPQNSNANFAKPLCVVELNW